jgi:hypothetical protein
MKVEAVVVNCEPLITKEIGCHRLSQRVNKMGFFLKYISLLYKGYKNTFEHPFFLRFTSSL